MRIKLATCAVAAAAILTLAACGGDDDNTSAGTTQAPSQSESNSGNAGEAAGSLVGTGSTDLGKVLTNADGMTLYAFEPDEGGHPTCDGSCASMWPPLTVESDQLPDGLDSSQFSVVERSDGSHQLASNDWPLYVYSGDQAAGDANGQGIEDKWYAVGDNGKPIEDEATEGGSSDTTMQDSGSGSGNDSGY